MDFCSGCGQYFVNEEDLYFHECFEFVVLPIIFIFGEE